MDNLAIYLEKFFIKFSYHPFVTGTVLFFIAKRYWLDQFLFSNRANRISDIQSKIIADITLVRNNLNTVKFYYHRVINTVRHHRQSRWCLTFLWWVGFVSLHVSAVQERERKASAEP